MSSREDLKPERKRFKLFQLRWKEPLGKIECPYAYRYVLNVFNLFSLRLHVWHRSDDKRYFHDHPYSFLVIVLKGGYTDVSPFSQYKWNIMDALRYHLGKFTLPMEKVNGEFVVKDELTIGSIRFRKATHKHYVDVPPGDCVTFLITGPHIRDWGFWVKGKLKRPMKFFHAFGHPPCDEQ